MNDIVGKSYTFPDGNSISVLQIKLRDGNEEWVTYMVKQGPGIPQKLVMKLDEFNHHYGHLFGIKSDDNLGGLP